MKTMQAVGKMGPHPGVLAAPRSSPGGHTLSTAVLSPAKPAVIPRPGTISGERNSQQAVTGLRAGTTLRKVGWASDHWLKWSA